MQTTEQQPAFTPQTLSQEELAEQLGTDFKRGLTAKQHRARLSRYGKNLFRREIELHPRTSWSRQLHGMTNLFFLVSMLVLYLFRQEWIYLLAVGVVLLLMLFGTASEIIAARILKKREKYSAHSVTVIRDGEMQKTDSRLLVPGDLLLLEKGCLVPADVRILDDDGRLVVLETPVSGVKNGVRKAAFAQAHADEAVSQNMLYAGSILRDGACLAAVCRTGDQTLLRQIHARKADYLPPLLAHIREWSRYTAIACILGCFLLVILGTVRGAELTALFALSVAVGASSLCDTVLSVALVSFGDGLAKMADHKLIVRNLDRITRLAQVNTVMCTKELTFPPKKPKLHCIYANGTLSPADNPPPKAAQELLLLSLACSDHPRRRLPFEQVVYSYLRDYCISTEELTEQWFRIDTSYGSEGEVNAVLSLHADHNTVIIKGSPEMVLSRCAGYEQDGKEYKLTAVSRRKILAAAENAAKSNAYLLAIASGTTDADSLRSPFAERRLIFRGFLTFRLAMEVDVAGGIYRASRAGIEAVVSTNDPYYTAASLAKSTGIITSEGEMISSREIKAADRGIFVMNAGKYKVFLEPDDEQWLDVLLLRKQARRTVLATGSREEELPLMRESDVSAVPVGSSDVLRESADLLMQENGFHVLADGILGARMLYFRLHRLLQYLTAGVCSLFASLLLATVIGSGMPFRVQEVLFGGILANLAIACVIALLPTDRKALQLQIPRTGRQRILQDVLPPCVYAVGNGVALYVLFRLTHSTECVMLGFVLSQFFYACGCLWEEGAVRRKSFGCRALWTVFPCILVFLALLLVTPGLSTALGFVRPSWSQLPITLFTVSVWHAAVQAFLFFQPKRKRKKDK